MSSRRVLTLTVLMFWVLLGPFAMAFDGCLVMGALCDGSPCGTFSSASFAPALLTYLEPAAYLEAQPRDQLPASSLTGLEPPPKSPLPSA